MIHGEETPETFCVDQIAVGTGGRAHLDAALTPLVGVSRNRCSLSVGFRQGTRVRHDSTLRAFRGECQYTNYSTEGIHSSRRISSGFCPSTRWLAAHPVM